MALPGNPSHIFTDFTTTAATTVQPFTAVTRCGWWAIRNNDGGANLYVKTTATNSTANSIPVAPGEYKIVGLTSNLIPYDLSEYGIYSTGTISYTIEYKKV